MIDACKRASARSVTAVVPYFGYARADRKTQGRESIAAKLVANLITESGKALQMILLCATSLAGLQKVTQGYKSLVQALATATCSKS